MTTKKSEKYILDQQIGFILRKVNQRHTGIFTEIMPEKLTPTRFAAMAKLLERGSLSQNELGRLTAMDIATIKGVVDRLRVLNYVESTKDSTDARRQLIKLTSQGRAVVQAAIPLAVEVSKRTVDCLSEDEIHELKECLVRIT